MISKKKISDFRKNVWNYYKSNKRPMPWRDDTSPYAIVVSEVMLQQTQVPRVLKLYPSFMQAFPSFAALVAAPTPKLLRAWQGLGYNRRALMLKKLAHEILTAYTGILPNDYESLLELPGIGPATASSIRAFAFNEPEVFIETNIRSVFIHEFFPKKKAVPDKKILPLVKATLDTQNPREWYWALMDYGTHIKSLYPNPSRKSAHHARQSPFQGSVRKIRGAILRELLKEPQNIAVLKKKVEAPIEKIETAIRGLLKDGFCIQKGDSILIR